MNKNSHPTYAIKQEATVWRFNFCLPACIHQIMPSRGRAECVRHVQIKFFLIRAQRRTGSTFQSWVDVGVSADIAFSHHYLSKKKKASSIQLRKTSSEASVRYKPEGAYYCSVLAPGCHPGPMQDAAQSFLLKLWTVWDQDWLLP